MGWTSNDSGSKPKELYHSWGQVRRFQTVVWLAGWRKQLMKRFPVVEAVSYILAHAPDLVRYGSKPSREIARNRDFLASLREHQKRPRIKPLRYLPNQVFLGGADPDRLRPGRRGPWWPVRADVTPSEMGRFYSQTSLYGLLKWNDHCNLLHLGKGLLRIGSSATENRSRLLRRRASRIRGLFVLIGDPKTGSNRTRLPPLW